jgi:hypothetical protein
MALAMSNGRVAICFAAFPSLRENVFMPEGESRKARQTFI